MVLLLVGEYKELDEVEYILILYFSFLILALSWNVLFFMECFLLLQYTLMKDPVILPSSKVTVDRSVILRHLLSDSVTLLFTLPIYYHYYQS